MKSNKILKILFILQMFLLLFLFNSVDSQASLIGKEERQ